MSPKKLCMMLLLLSVVWVLCYNAEQKLPERESMDMYNRMPDQDISKEKL